MKTTKEMEAYFLRIGFKSSDLRQLREAVSDVKVHTYDSDGNKKPISQKKAIELCGLEGFLASTGRAAFHRTAGRMSNDGKTEIGFDLRHWWK